MDNHRESNERDRVDVAAAAMREMHVPAGPSELLMQRTIKQVGAGDKKSVTSQKGWWSMRTVRRTAVAAALILAVGVGAILVPWGRGGGVAFADVIEQVKKAHAVRYKSVVELEGSPNHVDTLVTDTGIVVTDLPNMKQVLDAKAGKILILNKDKMVAMVVDTKRSPDAAKAMPNLLETFKQFVPEGSKPLGEKEIEGHKVKGFSSIQPNGTQMEVWADVATDRPVQVSMVLPTNDTVLSGVHNTMSNFDWDPKFNPEDVSTAIPPGYQSTALAIDMSNLKEQDVAAMLQDAAEMNEGVFPENVDMMGIMKISADWIKRQPRPVGDATKMQQEMLQKMTAKIGPVARAWAFIGDTSKGTAWHYNGKGIKLGEKGRPIFWYKPAAGDNWRVLDGDLAIHDEKAPPAGGTELKPTLIMLNAGTATTAPAIP